MERSKEGLGNWEGLASSYASTGSDPGEASTDDEAGFDLSSTGFQNFRIENIQVLNVRQASGPDVPRRPLLLKLLEGSAPAGEPIRFHVEGILKGPPLRGRLRGRIARHVGPSERTVAGDHPRSPRAVSLRDRGPASHGGFRGSGADALRVGDSRAGRAVSPHRRPAASRNASTYPAPPIAAASTNSNCQSSTGTLGDSPVEGSASLDLSGEVPLVGGALAVDFVHLDLFRKTDFTPDEEDTEPAETGSRPRPAGDARAEAAGLPFHGNLRLQIEEIRGIESPATIRDVDLSAELSEGIVTAELTTVFAEVPLQGRLEISGDHDEKVLLDLDLKGEEAELTELFAHYFKHDKFEGRLESVHYRIEGRGSTLADAWDARAVLLRVKNADVAYPFFGREYRFFVEEGSAIHHGKPEALVLLSGEYREAPFDMRLELVETPDPDDARVRVREASGRFADISIAVTNERLSEPYTPDNVRLSFELSGDRLDKLDHVYELNLPPFGPYAAQGVLPAHPRIGRPGRVPAQGRRLSPARKRAIRGSRRPNAPDPGSRFLAHPIG